MQMFGIGVLELLVILLLTVLVVGPDRMPQVAADLARWIRQGRAYARHLMGDFNQVVGELQKEANVSQEDWKEIANVVSRNTGEVGKELTRAAHDVDGQILFELGRFEDAKRSLDTAVAMDPEAGHAAYHLALVLERLGNEEDAGDLALAKAEEEPVATASKNGNGANGSAPQEAEAKSEGEAEPTEETPAEDKPWYEPEKTPRASRRRRSTE